MLDRIEDIRGIKAVPYSTHMRFIYGIALHSVGRGPVMLLLFRYLRREMRTNI